MKRISFAAGTLSCLLAASAWAQTAIQPGTIVGTFDAQGYLDGPAIYTVPAGRTARVTDLHMANFTDATCLFYMSFGGTSRWYYVPARASLVVPLNTGFGLVAGQTVNGGGCSGDSYVQLRGFYFTIP